MRFCTLCMRIVQRASYNNNTISCNVSQLIRVYNYGGSRVHANEDQIVRIISGGQSSSVVQECAPCECYSCTHIRCLGGDERERERDEAHMQPLGYVLPWEMWVATVIMPLQRIFICESDDKTKEV